MAHPLVSVVMAVRDGAEFLSDTIDSILRQTFDDFEFVVIDDGSTDATAEIVQRYARDDRRIQLHARPHEGMATALNRGWRLARGKYIARIDADDIAHSNRLDRQVKFLEERAEVAVVGGAFEYMSRDGAGRLFMPLPESDAEIKRVLPSSNCLAHPTVTMRASTLAEMGGYRPAFMHAEDYDLWLRMAERYRLANISEPLVRYRVHPGQISLRFLRQQTISALGARIAARSRRESGIDPFSHVERVSESLLYQQGVTRETIKRAVADSAQMMARISSQLNEQARGDQVLAKTFPEPTHWHNAKIHLSSGDIKQGLKFAAKAILRNLVMC